MSRIGTMLSTDPAITTFHWVVYWPCRVARASGSVAWSGVLMITSGHRKLFQLDIKANTAKVASAGRTFGKMMRVKMVRCPAPSTSAASSSSVGTAKIDWRIKKTPNAEAMPGARIAW
jgi:hypothetical protein